MKAGTITNWQPSRYDERTIEREFLQECRRQGLNICANNCEVRGPSLHHSIDDHDVALRWHKDTHGLFHTNHDDYIVMWSNIMPTEITDGMRRYDGVAGDIVVVDNEKVWHRAPKGANRANRWFVRAHIHK